jgi:ABC-type nitrate/sulfonate/bicarbonate transport system permease component
MLVITMTIDVEMVFGNTGLGSVFWLVWETMRMTDFYSAILIVSIIGISFTLLFEWSKKS